jgi:glycine/D-amino acid oxidase-like deaminating enzyme
MYDIVIAGAGIAGLTAAYRVLQQHPTWRLAILEKTNKIGGRAQIARFAGTFVATGAGVGRKEKDALLTDLLSELKVTWRESPVGAHGPEQRARLTKLQQNHPSHGESFAAYGRRILGTHEYKQFIFDMGFSDMERADAAETLSHYGLDDNVKPWTAMHIDWNALMRQLQQHIKSMNGTFMLNTTVETINLHEVHTSRNVILTKRIILATTVDVIKTLLPPKLRAFYSHIHSQPFLRIYAKVSRSSINLMLSKVPHVLAVGAPLQKIIPIQPSSGVYMIAYADNRSAVINKDNIANTEENRLFWSHLLEQALNIDEGSIKLTSIIGFYWQSGTHYYDPKTDFSENAVRLHPQENVWVIGEAVSHNQGWCEGALETVERLLETIN